MEDTVSDFWRMIWEQQSKVILMLTDLEENGVVSKIHSIFIYANLTYHLHY